LLYDVTNNFLYFLTEILSLLLVYHIIYFKYFLCFSSIIMFNITKKLLDFETHKANIETLP